MQRAAKHLVWGTNSIGATGLIAAPREMLRCPLHDSLYRYSDSGTGMGALHDGPFRYSGTGLFPNSNKLEKHIMHLAA